MTVSNTSEGAELLSESQLTPAGSAIQGYRIKVTNPTPVTIRSSEAKVNSNTKSERQSFESPDRKLKGVRVNEDLIMNIEELSGLKLKTKEEVKQTPLGKVNDFFKQIKFE